MLILTGNLKSSQIRFSREFLKRIKKKLIRDSYENLIGENFIIGFEMYFNFIFDCEVKQYISYIFIKIFV